MSYLYCFPSGLLFYFFFPSLIKLISVHNNYDAAIYTWRDRLTFTTTQFVSRCRWLIEEYVCTLPTCFNFFAVLWMSLSSVTASKIFNFVLYAILFMPTTSRSTCTIIGLWSAGHTLALEFSDLSECCCKSHKTLPWIFIALLEVLLPYDPLCPSVVDRSVSHNILRGREGQLYLRAPIGTLVLT